MPPVESPSRSTYTPNQYLSRLKSIPPAERVSYLIQLQQEPTVSNIITNLTNTFQAICESIQDEGIRTRLSLRFKRWCSKIEESPTNNQSIKNLWCLRLLDGVNEFESHSTTLFVAEDVRTRVLQQSASIKNDISQLPVTIKTCCERLACINKLKGMIQEHSVNATPIARLRSLSTVESLEEYRQVEGAKARIVRPEDFWG